MRTVQDESVLVNGRYCWYNDVVATMGLRAVRKEVLKSVCAGGQREERILLRCLRWAAGQQLFSRRLTPCVAWRGERDAATQMELQSQLATMIAATLPVTRAASQKWTRDNVEMDANRSCAAMSCWFWPARRRSPGSPGYAHTCAGACGAAQR